MEYQYKVYKVKTSYLTFGEYGKPILTDLFDSNDLKGWELFNILPVKIEVYGESDVILYHFRKPIKKDGQYE